MTAIFVSRKDLLRIRATALSADAERQTFFRARSTNNRPAEIGT